MSQQHLSPCQRDTAIKAEQAEAIEEVQLELDQIEEPITDMPPAEQLEGLSPCQQDTVISQFREKVRQERRKELQEAISQAVKPEPVPPYQTPMGELTPAAQDTEQKKASELSQQTAKAAIAADESGSLHLQILALEQDMARLKAFDRIADKIQLKRDELVPKYREHVERYLDAGEVYDNPVLQTITVWLFDIDELGTAIEYAKICIEQNQPTPCFIKSGWPTFVANTLLEWAQEAFEKGCAVEPYFSQVFELVTKEWRLIEKLTAEWFKLAGQLLLRDSEGKPSLPSAVEDPEVLEQSLKLLNQAFELHSKVGVKTLINKVEQRLRKLEEE